MAEVDAEAEEVEVEEEIEEVLGDKVEEDKVKDKVKDRAKAMVSPTPDTRGPDTRMGPRSRLAGSTGFMGNLLFIVWNQERVRGKIILCQDPPINEILTSLVTRLTKKLFIKSFTMDVVTLKK